MNDRRIWRHTGVDPHAASELLDQLIQAEPGAQFQAKQGPMPGGELWVTRYTRAIGRVDGLTDTQRPGWFSPKPASEILQMQDGV